MEIVTFISKTKRGLPPTVPFQFINTMEILRIKKNILIKNYMTSTI